MGLFKRLVNAFSLLAVKNTSICSELFAGSPGKGMCWVPMNVACQWWWTERYPYLMWQWWTVFLQTFFLPVRACSIMSNLNLNQQAFIQPLFVPAFERVNKQLCLDCYLRAMLGDCFVLSQLSLALKLVIVQVSASNNIYHLLPNPWDSLWKARGWIFDLSNTTCVICAVTH